MELSFSYYLSHSILILKLLVYLEFLPVSILNNIFRNDFTMRLASLPMIHSLPFIYSISGESSDNFIEKKKKRKKEANS